MSVTLDAESPSASSTDCPNIAEKSRKKRLKSGRRRSSQRAVNVLDEAEEPLFLVPSLFLGREPTVWYDYPSQAGHLKRTTDAELRVQHTQRSSAPTLQFEVNVNCIAAVWRHNGLCRLENKKPESSDWLHFNCYWGTPLPEEVLGKLNSYQKVNHFPGSYSMGRKDLLWRNLHIQMRGQGASCKDEGFIAKSFILPQDRELMTAAFLEAEKEKGTAAFIMKPPGGAQGQGVSLVTKAEQVPREKQLVVQRYITDPLCINQRKFDLRVYVAVVSVDPLKIYIHREGLARFATMPYEWDGKNVDRLMHLTNYSLNKKSDDFEENDDLEKATGHKWALSALWRHMKEQLGIDVGPIWLGIKELIVKTLISVEHHIAGKVNGLRLPRQCCHELFGFDVLIDQQLKPWLIEVNVMPSLSSTSKLDAAIKSQVVADLMHLVGFVAYERKKWEKEGKTEKQRRLIYGKEKGTDEKRRKTIQELSECLLSEFSEEELELVMEHEDEYHRRGAFELAFPSCDVAKFTKYFQVARYSNMVLSRWMSGPDWSILRGHLARDPPPHAIFLESCVPSSPSPRSRRGSTGVRARRPQSAPRLVLATKVVGRVDNVKPAKPARLKREPRTALADQKAEWQSGADTVDQGTKDTANEAFQDTRESGLETAETDDQEVEGSEASEVQSSEVELLGDAPVEYARTEGGESADSLLRDHFEAARIVVQRQVTDSPLRESYGAPVVTPLLRDQMLYQMVLREQPHHPSTTYPSCAYPPTTRTAPSGRPRVARRYNSSDLLPCRAPSPLVSIEHKPCRAAWPMASEGKSRQGDRNARQRVRQKSPTYHYSVAVGGSRSVLLDGVPRHRTSKPLVDCTQQKRWQAHMNQLAVGAKAPANKRGTFVALPVVTLAPVKKRR